jgi:uncharacterized protein YgiM (DUF1202 family)
VLGLSKRMLIVIGALIVVAVLFFIQNGKNGNAQSGSDSRGGCQVQVTADILNVRSGPSTSDKVVGTLKTGATQAATATTQNGFRELSAGPWASEDFLKPVAGSC